MSRRIERRASQREAVLKAATEAIAAEGLEALTIARLAARIGVSVGGLYRYYPGKDAIVAALEQQALAAYAALQDKRLATVDGALRRRRAPPAVAALARLIAAGEVYLGHAAHAPVHHRLLDLFLSTPEPLLGDAPAREVEAALAPILGRCAALLDDAVAVGALAAGDAQVRTSALWALLHGVDHFRKRDRLLPPKLHARRIADDALDALLRGWGAAERDLAAARRAV
jgi:AcrR family transcriptional regulator